MTPEDRRDFNRFDEAVGLAAKAAKVVIDGGRALKAIRDRQLYRAVAETWEAYLERHGLTRRRADQIVAAAGVLDAVAERVEAEIGTAVPDLSERALRPLISMDADQAVEVMVEAAPRSARRPAGARPRPRPTGHAAIGCLAGSSPSSGTARVTGRSSRP